GARGWGRGGSALPNGNAGEPRAGAARTGPGRGTPATGPGQRGAAPRIPQTGCYPGLLPGFEIPGYRRHPGHSGGHREVALAFSPGEAPGGLVGRLGVAGSRGMKPSNENLLGYLLNALDENIHREVEAHLATSTEAQGRLELLRQALAPLAADRKDAPPPG